MNQKVFLIGIVVVIIIGGAFLLLRNNGDGTLISSIETGSEYNSTTTRSTSAGTHWQAKVASLGGCSLASVVIASSTNSTGFQLRDATSTTDVASTTIVQFKPSTVEGTYTFDLVCTRGLVVVTPTGFQGEYVVTWR